jgi:hypothetical protein
MKQFTTSPFFHSIFRFKAAASSQQTKNFLRYHSEIFRYIGQNRLLKSIALFMSQTVHWSASALSENLLIIGVSSTVPLCSDFLASSKMALDEESGGDGRSKWRCVEVHVRNRQAICVRSLLLPIFRHMYWWMATCQWCICNPVEASAYCARGGRIVGKKQREYFAK